jgi:hypothetical protein
MVFSDWTFTGDGTGCLDNATKHSGNSSYCSSTYKGANEGNGVSSLSRNEFSAVNFEAIFWVKVSPTDSGGSYARISHPNYGDLTIVYTSIAVDWNKFRVKFWYDTVGNVKWGRVEKSVGGIWVQQGSDTNFGVGSPAADTIILKTFFNGYSHTQSLLVWFDELEVYDLEEV